MIDEGVRELVEHLKTVGFETCDSGDGVSKRDPKTGELPECALPYPHVFMLVHPGLLMLEADRLLSLARSGPWSLKYGHPPRVEANYSPNDGVAILALTFQPTDE